MSDDPLAHLRRREPERSSILARIEAWLLGGLTVFALVMPVIGWLTNP